MLASSEIILSLVLGEYTIAKGFFRRTSKQATSAKHPYAHPLSYALACRFFQLLFSPTKLHGRCLSCPLPPCTQ